MITSLSGFQRDGGLQLFHQLHHLPQQGSEVCLFEYIQNNKDRHKTKVKAEGGNVFSDAKTFCLCGFDGKIFFFFLFV